MDMHVLWRRRWRRRKGKPSVRWSGYDDRASNSTWLSRAVFFEHYSWWSRNRWCWIMVRPFVLASFIFSLSIPLYIYIYTPLLLILLYKTNNPTSRKTLVRCFSSWICVPLFNLYWRAQLLPRHTHLKVHAEYWSVLGSKDAKAVHPIWWHQLNGAPAGAFGLWRGR